ncbi:holotricin-3 [Folsomia candida]|uniref:holotricin-3 n=1 Tax=Folsomia candida TaxID=158441 RepID=UPI000B8F8EDE|nr:holotricin-3 [Folsomia candida]
MKFSLILLVMGILLVEAMPQYDDGGDDGDDGGHFDAGGDDGGHDDGDDGGHDDGGGDHDGDSNRNPHPPGHPGHRGDGGGEDGPSRSQGYQRRPLLF